MSRSLLCPFFLFLFLNSQGRQCSDIRTGFLSSSWHITSHGMFGGSCIGVICLVVVLEFLRRAQREYNRFLSHKAITSSNRLLAKTSDTCCAERGQGSETSTEQDKSDTVVFATKLGRQRRVLAGPTVLQQAVRATIHMLQFAVAYFIMLLAMYFNGKLVFSLLSRPTCDLWCS